MQGRGLSSCSRVSLCLAQRPTLRESDSLAPSLAYNISFPDSTLLFRAKQAARTNPSLFATRHPVHGISALLFVFLSLAYNISFTDGTLLFRAKQAARTNPSLFATRHPAYGISALLFVSLSLRIEYFIPDSVLPFFAQSGFARTKPPCFLQRIIPPAEYPPPSHSLFLFATSHPARRISVLLVSPPSRKTPFLRNVHPLRNFFFLFPKRPPSVPPRRVGCAGGFSFQGNAASLRRAAALSVLSPRLSGGSHRAFRGHVSRNRLLFYPCIASRQTALPQMERSSISLPHFCSKHSRYERYGSAVICLGCGTPMRRGAYNVPREG